MALKYKMPILYMYIVDKLSNYCGTMDVNDFILIGAKKVTIITITLSSIGARKWR